MNQKTKAKYEILVIDDYEKDSKTKEVVDFWNKRITMHYLMPKKFGMLHGRTRIRNLGIRQAKGAIVVFLDDDMIVSPRFVEEHFSNHKNGKDNNVVIGYRNHLKITHKFLEYVNPVSIIGDPSIIEQLPVMKDERESVYRICHGDLHKLPAPWVLLFSNNISVKKNFLNRIGGNFNETFQGEWGGEDVELGFRLYKAGGNFVLNREAIGYHQWHYANWRKNIKSLKVNLQKLYTLHPCPDTELYLDYLNTGLIEYFNDLKAYTNNEDIMPTTPNKDSGEMLSINAKPNAKILLVGSNNVNVLKHAINACVDVRKKFFEQNRALYPEIQWYNIIGIHLPYNQKSMDIIIIDKEYLKLLKPDHRKQLFNECIRVADHVYFYTGKKTLYPLSKKRHKEDVTAALRKYFNIENKQGANAESINVDTGAAQFDTITSKGIQDPLQLALVVDSGMRDSYCDHAVELALSLSKRSCDVILDQEEYHSGNSVSTKKLPFWGKYSRDEQNILSKCLQNGSHKVGSSYPTLSLTGHTHITGQRIEWLRNKTSGVLSSPYIHVFNEQVDAVWCPSAASSECFVKSGGNSSKVSVIPIGISRSLAEKYGREQTFKKDDPFRFVLVGTIEKSSGLDIAIQAFCAAFKKMKDVELIIRFLPIKQRDVIERENQHNKSARAHYGKYREQVLALNRYRIDKWREYIRQNYPDSRRIKFEYLHEELRIWPKYFKGGHCYLQPHRSDLIGQRVIQAMSLGLPVITTGRYLPEELKQPGMNYFIRSREVTAAEGEWASEVVYERWAEPSVDQAVRLMRYVYLNRKEARARGARGKEYVFSNLTWDIISGRVIKSLEEFKNINKPKQKLSRLTELFADLKNRELINIEEESYVMR